MSLAWFLAPYKRLVGNRVRRYCAMDDFTAMILADKGAWAETEVLGDMALVKVRASDNTLTKIESTEGFQRIPLHASLTDSMSDLSVAQKTAIVNKITALGYLASEIQSKVGTDIGAKTLGDVLKFIATRRLKPRYDSASDTIVLDGDVQACRSVESVNAEVE